MANHGENTGGVVHVWEIASMREKEQALAAQKRLKKKQTELETINQIRKIHGKRPLTLEEFMAIGAPAPVKSTGNGFGASSLAKKQPPARYREAYVEFVKNFLKSLDVGSEYDIIERSKGVYFHYFTLSEFKEIVNKASARLLNAFLYTLKNRIDNERSTYAIEMENSTKSEPFRAYVDEKIKETAIAIKDREEAVEAVAKAAALKAEMDAVEAARKAEANAALAAEAAEAAVRAEKNKALNMYRQTIADFAGAQEKAGRSGNMDAKRRAMNLRAALIKYNANGSAVNEKLLTKKIKKNLADKGLTKKGGKRSRRLTRKH